MLPGIVLVTHALIAIGFAIPLLLAPSDLLELYGADPGPTAIYLARLFGAALLAFATICWLARELPEGDALDSICAGFALSSTVALVVALHHQLTSETANAFGWSTVAICLGLSVAYAMLVIGRAARRGAPPPTRAAAG
ncbi:MAG TPA: hypothetical protein VEA81_18615 [Burkholderiaceae bacterium]|nr:hypothetical protein [Burkholderiaceae bacterium]